MTAAREKRGEEEEKEEGKEERRMPRRRRWQALKVEFSGSPALLGVKERERVPAFLCGGSYELIE